VYTIIASDLDGTLLREDMTLSKENAAAMTALGNKGVFFVPASGRTLCEMPAEVKDHPHVRYVIYSNGAAIWDKQTDTHTHLCMSRRISNAVLDILKAYDCHILVRQGGKSYVDARFCDQNAFAHFQLSSAHCEVIRRYATKKDAFIPFAYTLDTVECYALFFSDDEEMARCKEKLSACEGLTVVPSWAHCLELFSAEAGKGAALRKLAEMTDTPMKDTVAVGDSGNDTSMIVDAGLGLATANACDSLKAVADATICSNRDHIVKYVLENYY